MVKLFLTNELPHEPTIGSSSLLTLGSETLWRIVYLTKSANHISVSGKQADTISCTAMFSNVHTNAL